MENAECLSSLNELSDLLRSCTVRTALARDDPSAKALRRNLWRKSQFRRTAIFYKLIFQIGFRFAQYAQGGTFL